MAVTAYASVGCSSSSEAPSDAAGQGGTVAVGTMGTSGSSQAQAAASNGTGGTGSITDGSSASSSVTATAGPGSTVGTTSSGGTAMSSSGGLGGATSGTLAASTTATTGSGGATAGAGGMTDAGATTTGGGGSGGGTAVTCPATAMAPGDSTQMVQVGALNRSYYLHIPAGYSGSEPLPLVIDFHPLGGTGMQQANSNSWKAKADSVGFIVAYPDSYNSNNSWNVGLCCMDAQQNEIDDVGFTRAMIEQISEKACVDPKRIYATGCSNGGGMTYKVACDLADVIAAAAPVDFRCVYGGSTNAPSCEGCMPSRPISVTHFDNTGDNALVPYDGGLTSFPADCPPGQACTGMGFPSAQENFETWQQIDECTGSASPLDGHQECQSNGSCGGSSQVTMCVQQGGSHCGNYSSLGIVDTAWEMFEHQSL